MASITVVPVDHDEIEVSCGDEVVRVIVNRGQGASDAKSDPGAQAPGGDGRQSAPSGGTGTPEPVFIPPTHIPFIAPTHIPLFVQQAEDKLVHMSFANVRSAGALDDIVKDFAAMRHGDARRRPYHLVLTLPQNRIDLHELHARFAGLDGDTHITINLTRDDA